MVIHHVYALTNYKEPFPSGYILLDMFFAISGFVLAEHYGRRLSEGMTLRDFMTRRINRLYPAYILGFLLSLITLRDSNFIDPQGAWGSLLGLFMLPDPFSSALFPTNVALWTLVYELGVNALMVLIWRRLSTAVLVGLIAIGAAANFYFLWQGGQADVAYAWQDWGMATSMAVMSFFLGVWVQKVKWRPTFLSPWVITVLLIGVSMQAWKSQWFSIFNLALALVMLPIVLLCAVARPPDRLWRAIFNPLGNASYPLYVMHMPMLVLLIKAGLHLHHPVGLVTMLWALPGMLIVSWLVDRYYEPFGRMVMREAPGFIRRKLAPGSAAPAVGAPGGVKPPRPPSTS